MAFLTFVIMVLAAARLTRIVHADTITSSLRLRVWRRFPPENKGNRRAHPLGQLIDCVWCIGYWTAGAVTFATTLVSSELNGVVWPLVVWQAVAWAQAVLASKLDV